MAHHATRNPKRRGTSRPLRFERLEARRVPATAGALPTAAVLAQSYTFTPGSDIAASTSSEAGGYTFAQHFRLTMAPTSGTAGGAFNPNDALNQFFDELMSGVDTQRGGALFGGAYGAVGVGPQGTTLPTATVEDQRFDWRGNDLVFSETLVSGGYQFQLAYSQEIGRTGDDGNVVTAVEAADQFFAWMATLQGDANFPGLPSGYVSAHVTGSTSASGTSGTAGTSGGTTTGSTGSASGASGGTSSTGTGAPPARLRRRPHPRPSTRTRCSASRRSGRRRPATATARG